MQSGRFGGRLFWMVPYLFCPNTQLPKYIRVVDFGGKFRLLLKEQLNYLLNPGGLGGLFAELLNHDGNP